MIGEKFISEFFDLAEDSFIYIDACAMYLDPVGSSGVRAALAAKSKGKTNILGYDENVYNQGSVQIASLLYDRLLGRNGVAPIDSPPQRPWSVSDAYYGMVNMGKATDPIPGGTANLILESKGGDWVQVNGLKPSIQHAKVHPPGSNVGGITNSPGWLLSLFGYFGTEAGTVTLNGSPLTLATPWKNGTQSIYFNLPAGASGNVVVDVLGHRSNTVPLTQWYGTVSQSFIDSGIGERAAIDVVCPFRATDDVHFKRSVMEGAQPTVGMWAYLDSTAACTYNMTGTWSDDTYNYSLSGSGAVQPISSFREAYGTVISPTSASTSLPIDANVGYNFSLNITGTLTKTNRSTHEVTTSPANSGWRNGNDKTVRLGTDYRITKPSSSCATGSAPCTETWNFIPTNTPTSQTPG